MNMENKQSVVNKWQRSIEIEGKTYYFFKALREYLGGYGLPNARPTLVNYEKEGIIPGPDKRMNVKGREYGYRLYTKKRMIEIRRKIERYKFDG